MPKNIQITLYDVFGYFLPGVVASTGIGILFWWCFYRNCPLPFSSVRLEVWIAVGLFAYFIGHLTHAVADLIFRVSGRPEDKALERVPRPSTPEEIPASLREAARGKAARLMGVDQNQINNALLFSVCDEALSQTGEIGDREIYQYRAGFYKGMTISLGFLLLVSTPRFFNPPAFLIEGKMMSSSRGEIFFGLMVLLIATVFFYRKYSWFVNHRVRRALLGFMIVCKATTSATPGSGPHTHGA